jgi:hypothetical protein
VAALIALIALGGAVYGLACHILGAARIAELRQALIRKPA